mgnify:CR=1 FL=1
MQDTDEKLISKKQLLDKYGFSYGALYRWKRMGLIPDEWFIKKSTVTGQETFFPEDAICERVEMILSKKENVQLEEIAEKISVDERQSDYLVISTKYGDKEFNLNDIKKIKVVIRNAEEDITDAVLSIKAAKDEIADAMLTIKNVKKDIRDALSSIKNED